MTELQIPNEFSAALQQLDKLSRNHLLYFRLEVGKLLLTESYDGAVAAYHSQDPAKPHKFNQFISTCAQDLEEIGLAGQVLRQCIVAHMMVKALPPPTVAKLQFSQVVELTRVADPATRSVLAQATVDNHWSCRQLKDAAKAANAGNWLDGDPKTPGLQPVAPPAVVHPVQVGRLVTRFEKMAKQAAELVAAWKLVEGKATDKQRREQGKAVVAFLAACGGQK